MNLTKFQALVSRESLAEVYPKDGKHSGGAYSDHGPHVLAFGEMDGRLMIQIQCCSETEIHDAANLTPSRHLLELIERGIYNEETMTWQIVVEGQHITEPLSY